MIGVGSTPPQYPDQTNFIRYISHFRMPSGHSGGTGNFWYLFGFGMAHLIQLDTGIDLSAMTSLHLKSLMDTERKTVHLLIMERKLRGWPVTLQPSIVPRLPG
jgi:hypothetical protein